MLHLVTGGTSNGKSAIAEELCRQYRGSGPMWYIATMRVWDGEGEKKVARHRRRRRGMGFRTIERYTDAGGLKVSGTCLLECLSNLLANEMFDKSRSGREAERQILSDIKALRDMTDNLVVVTNDVFEDGTEYSDATMDYLQALGRLNAAVAALADRVTEAVAGIPLTIK